MLYYFLYGLFYLLSLIPWRIMYIISDGLYLITYFLVGYRKDVVMENLSVAFPDKTEAERKQIAKGFYKNFIDTFIEMVKLFSISRKEFDKRIKVSGVDILNELKAKGQSVQFHSGHFFNWEILNLGLAAHNPFPFLGVYTPISNKSFEKIILHIRAKFGTILISTSDFPKSFPKYAKSLYSIGLVADQNPPSIRSVFWARFFGKPTPFPKGPEKGAKLNNTAVVLVNLYSPKRGHYQMDLSLLTDEPRNTKEGYITNALITFIEESVYKRPSNYLWSHRRWKWTYDPTQHVLLEK